jgi:hypothetical protein
MPPNVSEIAAEITRLHDFFTQWFAGTIANDNDVFDREVSDTLVDGFVNIQPAGTMLSRDLLLEQIRSGHGKNPAFNISVENVRLHHHLPGDILLVTYEEYQQGAMNSASENGRLSTALLRPVDGRFEWLWVHETALPPENTPPQISAI